MAATASAADARPVQKNHRQAAVVAPVSAGSDQDPRYPRLAERQQAAAAAPAVRSRRSRAAQAQAQAETPATGLGIFGSGSLVSEARKHLGTNPTGRSSLWCGAFMDMVLKKTGHAGGGNLASAYARYGTRVSGPQVGAIAVMGRKGGGHVGVVTGVDASGNPIIVSGNHNRTVAETVYPASRITAYVLPGG
jgi:uncharacterized protein (TIGR02594 family)